MQTELTALATPPSPPSVRLQKPSHPGEPLNFPNATALNHVFKCKRDKPRSPFDDF